MIYHYLPGQFGFLSYEQEEGKDINLSVPQKDKQKTKNKRKGWTKV